MSAPDLPQTRFLHRSGRTVLALNTIRENLAELRVAARATVVAGPVRLGELLVGRV